MTWRTFRILAIAINALVFLPLWFIWINEGVVAGIDRLLPRLFMSVLASMALTFLLLLVTHLALFGLAKWRGELPRSDGAARFMGLTILGLLIIGGIGFAFNAQGWNIAAPFSAISSACVVFLLFLLISGRWTILLKDVIAFRSIKSTS